MGQLVSFKGMRTTGILVVVAVIFVVGIVVYKNARQTASPTPRPPVTTSAVPAAKPPSPPAPPVVEKPAELGKTVFDAANPATPEPVPAETLAQQLTRGKTLVEEARRAKAAGDKATMIALLEQAMQEAPNSPDVQKELLEIVPLYLADNKEWEARNALSIAVQRDGLTPKERKELVGKLDKLNEELIFSKKPSKDSILYTVKPGDTLARIARAHKIGEGLIRRINGLKSDLIHAGRKFKIVPGPYDAVVDKSEFRLTIYLNGRFIREYPIGLGKDGGTPVGSFVVSNKLREPTWISPEGKAVPFPHNPLGTRWLTFSGEYGIHGTWEPESIGKEMSEGCVRMLNADVEEVFEFLVERDSKIIVRP